jgi:hypothetical protein
VSDPRWLYDLVPSIDSWGRGARPEARTPISHHLLFLLLLLLTPVVWSCRRFNVYGFGRQFAWRIHLASLPPDAVFEEQRQRYTPTMITSLALTHAHSL